MVRLGRLPGVSVKGRVISCDLCGQLMAMPTAMKHAEKRYREESVRGYAVGWGWHRVEDGDRCPDHAGDDASRGRLTRRLSDLRNRFPAILSEPSPRRTGQISPRIDDRPARA